MAEAVLTKWSEKKLEGELQKLNGQRDELATRAKAVAAELNVRRDKQKVIDTIAGLTPAQRELLQTVDVDGITSEEAFGDIGSKETS